MRRFKVLAHSPSYNDIHRPRWVFTEHSSYTPHICGTRRILIRFLLAGQKVVSTGNNRKYASRRDFFSLFPLRSKLFPLIKTGRKLSFLFWARRFLFWRKNSSHFLCGQCGHISLAPHFSSVGISRLNAYPPL